MTRRDAAEVQAFDHRRLVAAFLSGGPGDRDIEPSWPGRALAAGIALAVLLVAGAVIVAVLAPRTAADWDRQGVVVSKDTGARYLITHDGGALRPLINLTSAQLVLGMGYRLTMVSQETVDERAPGADIGILGAPPELPATSAFIPSGWTACTASGAGVAVDVSTAPPVAAADGQGLLVRSGGHDYLVADGNDGRAHAFPIQSPLTAQAIFADTDAMPTVLNVPRAWLALFDRRSSLRYPSGVRAIRTSAGYVALRTTGVGSSAMTIGPFAAYLIAHGEPPKQQLPRGTRADDHLLDGTSYRGWPYQLLNAARPGPVCAQLHAAAGQPSTATLVSATAAGAWPATAPKAGVSVVRVDPARGAFVRATAPSAHARGRAYIVASTGRRYLLTDPSALGTLGLTSYAAPTVDPHWLALFPRGPPLSRRLALCTPRASTAPRC